MGCFKIDLSQLKKILIHFRVQEVLNLVDAVGYHLHSYGVLLCLFSCDEVFDLILFVWGAFVGQQRFFYQKLVCVFALMDLFVNDRVCYLDILNLHLLAEGFLGKIGILSIFFIDVSLGY